MGASAVVKRRFLRVDGLSEGIPVAHSRNTSCVPPRAIPLLCHPAAPGDSNPLTGIPSDSPLLFLRFTISNCAISHMGYGYYQAIS